MTGGHLASLAPPKTSSHPRLELMLAPAMTSDQPTILGRTLSVWELKKRTRRPVTVPLRSKSNGLTAFNLRC
jgi:hypothetical protein